MSYWRRGLYDVSRASCRRSYDKTRRLHGKCRVGGVVVNVYDLLPGRVLLHSRQNVIHRTPRIGSTPKIRGRRGFATIARAREAVDLLRITHAREAVGEQYARARENLTKPDDANKC
jgi:hypothetical protein